MPYSLKRLSYSEKPALSVICAALTTGLLKGKRSDIYTRHFHYHIPFVSVSVLATRRKDKGSTSFCLKGQRKAVCLSVSLKSRCFQYRSQAERTGGIRPLDLCIPGAT